MVEHIPLNRIKWKFVDKVTIPDHLKQLLWDEHTQVALEKLIVRVLQYGNFDELQYIYTKYPEETTDVMKRYPNLRRGVKFWIAYWNKLL